MTSKKTVLITGCSKGGLGDALAQAFHSRGLRVIATARNVSKMAHFKSLGIETVLLDVLSQTSITECVSTVSQMTNGRLDILLNNSGGGYSMPLSDVSIPAAREVFDLNVFSVIAVTQAFLPLLLKAHHGAGAMIVNNTSISSVVPVAMTGIYNASKAATAMLTDTLRIEMQPFGIKVIDLKTGAIKSGFYAGMNGDESPRLPENSIYGVAREEVEKKMTGEWLEKDMVNADIWAKQVVGELLGGSPAIRIWKGGNSWLTWFARRFFPFTFLDGAMSESGGLDIVKRKLAAG